MNREEVISMAREAGFMVVSEGDPEIGAWYECFTDEIERFAALVAAAEREKVARWQIGSGYSTGHGETIEDLLVELEWQVRESEREACAKVCEEQRSIEWVRKSLPALIKHEPSNIMAEKCAAAIRARGQG